MAPSSRRMHTVSSSAATRLLDKDSPVAKLWATRRAVHTQRRIAYAGPLTVAPPPALWEIAGIPRSALAVFGAWAPGECIPSAHLLVHQCVRLTMGALTTEYCNAVLMYPGPGEDAKHDTAARPFARCLVLAGAVLNGLAGTAEGTWFFAKGRKGYYASWEHAGTVADGSLFCIHGFDEELTKDMAHSQLSAFLEAYRTVDTLTGALGLLLTPEDAAELGERRVWNGRFCGLWLAAVLAELARYIAEEQAGLGAEPAQRRGFGLLLAAHVLKSPASAAAGS